MKRECSLKRSPAPFRLVSGLICAAFMLLSISGCTRYDPEDNNFDNVGFCANLKEDTLSPIGKKAAYYDGRIYYLSSELGTQGIYSMDTAGKDVKLEIPVEDIRSINVRNDGIYYAGFAGIRENDLGQFRQFRLLIRKYNRTEIADYLKDVGYPDDWPDEDRNVWDFYIADQGVVVICFAEVGSYRLIQSREVVSFQNGQAVPMAGYELINENTSIHNTSFNQGRLEIGHLEGLYFLPDYFSYPEYTGDYLSLCLSVIDLNAKDHGVKMLTDWLGYNDNNSDYLRWFCRGSADGFILASVHGLEKFDIATNTVTSIVSFEQPENIYAQIDCGDNFLVFTELLRKTYDLDYRYSKILKQTRALAESLYRVDPETGAKQLLLTLEHENAFLYADAKTAVTGGDKTISIYDISGDTAKLQRTIEIGHNVVDYSNKTDTAGGWLFLYHFNEETQRDELIEKVYIGA